MISAVNFRPLNGFLLPCFTASPSLRPHFIAGVGEASKLQQNHVTLVGHSFGGAVAMTVALHRPDKVS
jgi:pimeloyl-ACP methyl ester carboxylesterase